MQLDQITKTKLTDFIAGSESANQTNMVQKEEKTSGSKTLRTITINNPSYNLNQLQQDSLAEQLEEKLEEPTDASLLHNQMAVYANTTTPEEFKKMQEEGFAPEDMEATTIVTVTDHIKLALAKGGADLSSMGGLSEKKLEAMTTSAVEKNQVEVAMNKASQLEGELSSECAAYMVKNNTPATIDGVFEAVYATGEKTETTAMSEIPEDLQAAVGKVLTDAGLEITEENMSAANDLMSQNIPLTEETISSYVELQGISLDYTTEEISGRMVDALLEGKAAGEASLLPGEDFYNRAAITYQNQMEVLSDMEQTLSDITSKRAVEEARMLMSVEANYSLLKQGISIDTMSIQESIDALRGLEEDYLAKMFGGAVEDAALQDVALSDPTDPSVSDGNQISLYIENYKNVMSARETISIAPISFVANITALEKMNLQQVGDLAASELAKITGDEESENAFAKIMGDYKIENELAKITGNEKIENAIAKTTGGDRSKNAIASYETLWTSPRKDLGDSMQKAFANVDDILDDLGFETTDNNRKSVRILAYNQMDLSKENITNTRSTLLLVQETIKALKPATVMEMIKEGKNPLDLTMDDLLDLAKNMSEKMSGGEDSNSNLQKESQSFAKFLWKLEQTEDLSEDQRNSYIGIYRMIHQVEAGDGAAIGSLMQQKQEVTLRNLMTAVRSKKHAGSDFKIDDSFGLFEGFDKSIMTITEQAEMSFQANCLYRAADHMDGNTMSQFENEDAYLNLTPEEFDEALEQYGKNVDTSEYGKNVDTLEYGKNVDTLEYGKNVDTLEYEKNIDTSEYEKIEKEEVMQALRAEEEVYNLLESNDIKITPANLFAMNEFMRDRNSVYRNLNRYINKVNGTEETTISDLINDLIEDFGEACKTPKEMADAQHELEETAENVMKKMLVETDVHSIDVRGMKLVVSQLKTLGKISQKDETYNIPILVEDKLGNLSLKIVHGGDEKGRVDVAFETEDIGKIQGAFHYEDSQVYGELDFSKDDMAGLFSENMPYFAEAMGEQTGLAVSFKFGVKEDFSADTMDEKSKSSAGNVGFAEKNSAKRTTLTEENPVADSPASSDEISTQKLYQIARCFINQLAELLS